MEGRGRRAEDRGEASPLAHINGRLDVLEDEVYIGDEALKVRMAKVELNVAAVPALVTKLDAAVASINEARGGVKVGGIILGGITTLVAVLQVILIVHGIH